MVALVDILVSEKLMRSATREDDAQVAGQRVVDTFLVSSYVVQFEVMSRRLPVSLHFDE